MNKNQNEIRAYLALCSKMPGLRFSELALRITKDGVAFCTTWSPNARRWKVDLERATATEVMR